MSTATVHPAGVSSTHTSAVAGTVHLLGTALRAVGVMASAAFEVVVLGRVEEEAPRYASSISSPAASSSPASTIR
ncbi:hypothetical protein [Streptomyces litchfieldiae]|uniref:Uncharacterized protein n=1 Tax=Streptomyces litchfieldiae TaxID=3075543 RepID=A0ABU2MQA5_9ACTN|nr:hypothetical protein [Streptomyces sp. DSM 44938]MDT0343274.1 hypothetical protein [Streptomyces sp. DSM 44938]